MNNITIDSTKTQNLSAFFKEKLTSFDVVNFRCISTDITGSAWLLHLSYISTPVVCNSFGHAYSNKTVILALHALFDTHAFCENH